MIYLLQHSVFAAAARFPEREAFVCGTERMTYATLAGRVERLALTLRRQGVQPGDRVGIYLHRCVETAVAIYGILHAGAVFVPLNPKAPPARNAFVIEDCGIDVLISHPSQKRGVKALVGAGTRVQKVVGISQGEIAGVATTPWAEVYARAVGAPARARTVETDLAYIIYTSGSTGKPKGIMHSHASGLAFARNAVARYDLTGEDRFGNHAPIYFDVSQLACFAAPLVGGTAVLATDAETIFPASLGKMMARERITVWYSVPLALVQLLNSGTAETLDLSHLRRIFYAGEALAPKYARQLLDLCPAARLGNWYGPAETNVCTCYDLPGPPEGEAPIPIGDVWANTDRLIVDADGREVTPGETGELLIRGTTRMLGYWKLPERSAAAWHVQKLEGRPDRRFYRTGDLVREQPEGILHFLGRADQQVKVRGYRVELGAIERLLLTHPTVSEACALALPGGKDDALTIHVAVLFNASGPVTDKDLLDHLRAELPHYAVPGHVLPRDRFPRTASGKIDRAELKRQLLT